MRLILISCALIVTACASTPPPTSLLQEAESMLETASDAQAAEHAPIELRFAREKLAGARLAIEERNFARATRLAEQSVVNSELAIAKTAAAQARAAARRQQQANDELRQQLESGGDQ